MSDELGELKNVLIEKLFECCSLSSEYKKSDILEFYEECADDKNYISGFIEEVDAINKKITTDKTPKRNTHSNIKPDNLLPNTETTLQFPQKSLQSYLSPQQVPLQSLMSEQEMLTRDKLVEPLNIYSPPSDCFLNQTQQNVQNTPSEIHTVQSSKEVVITNLDSTIEYLPEKFEELCHTINTECGLSNYKILANINLHVDTDLSTNDNIYKPFFEINWTNHVAICIEALTVDNKLEVFGCYVPTPPKPRTWTKDPNVRLFSSFRGFNFFGLKEGITSPNSIFVCDKTNQVSLFAVGLNITNDIIFVKNNAGKREPFVFLEPSVFDYKNVTFFEPKKVHPKCLLV
ncbi:Hypothetical protein EIN_252660, partial [Entamoeba invadens IP1]